LTAPFDGTILSAEAIVGGTVGEESIITLGVLNPKTLEVYLDESDLQMVVDGYPVDIVFDAYPDDTFTGAVTQISRSLQTVSEVSAIKAIVQMDEENIDPDLSLPVGLSATVDVIAGRVTDAVLVPIEGLRDLGDGGYAVFVVVDGEPEMRVVEVGLMDATYAEIKSGLQAGETVSTGTTYTFE
jgi:multidrug efflux pump subunit AcrA (membrane-fusion protein)